MGCGCKNDSIESSFNNVKEKNFLNIFNNVFLNKKFSFGGLLIFLITLPVVITLTTPFIIIILFNKFVLSKDTDIINLIAFTKNKKTKK